MTPSQIRRLRFKLGNNGKPLPAHAFAGKLMLTGKHRGLLVYKWESGIKKPGTRTILLMKQLE